MPVESFDPLAADIPPLEPLPLPIPRPGAAAKSPVVPRPPGVGRFQFVVLSTLRAAQLMRGCRPRVDPGHKAIVTAQLEVSEGKVKQMFASPDAPAGPDAVGAPSIEEVPAIVAES